MDIGTATCLSHLLTHILIEGRHHRGARIVLHIFACASNGNGCTLRGSDTQHIDTHAMLFRCFSSLYCPTLVVFTIGNHHNGLSDTLFLREAVRGHLNSTSDIRALSSHHRRIDAREEHLGRNIVTRDRQLYEGIASKDNQTDLIVSEVIDKILYHHLTTIQTARNDIFCPHGVTDIHRYDGLYAYPLFVVDLRTHLRTGQHHNEQSQGSLQNPELYRGSEPRHIRHQCLEQGRIAKLAQPFLLVAEGYKPDERQNRDQHQQIEIYGVFKSEHNSYSIFMVCDGKS